MPKHDEWHDVACRSTEIARIGEIQVAIYSVRVLDCWQGSDRAEQIVSTLEQEMYTHVRRIEQYDEEHA